VPIALNLSLVWFFVLGGLGAFFPFYALYLRENAGLSGTQVGLVMATLPLVGVLTQGLWGQLADRTGSRAQVLALLALGAALGYGAIPHSSGFTGFLVLTAVLALFSTSLIPTCVAVSLALLRESGGHGFGRVRVWGTVGFGVTVGLLPFALDAFQRWRGLPVVDAGPSEAGLELIFFAAAALVFCSGLLALRLPRAGAVGVRAARGDWKRLLRHGPFVRLLLLMFATYLCMQGPMALFPILVRAQGG
jgi:PPP family 3-phenylpropionic acid transporter